LYGNGQQTRDYIYMSDVVAALVTAATAKAVNRQVINIGSGVETSLVQLVTHIEQVTGKRVNQLTNQQKGGGVPRLVADISRAQQLLGFRPMVGLAEGLQRVLREDGRFQ
jgi:nucleoside-diphosphate-sugar epimerase